MDSSFLADVLKARIFATEDARGTYSGPHGHSNLDYWRLSDGLFEVVIDHYASWDTSIAEHAPYALHLQHDAEMRQSWCGTNPASCQPAGFRPHLA